MRGGTVAMPPRACPRRCCLLAVACAVRSCPRPTRRSSSTSGGSARARRTRRCAIASTSAIPTGPSRARSPPPSPRRCCCKPKEYQIGEDPRNTDMSGEDLDDTYRMLIEHCDVFFGFKLVPTRIRTGSPSRGRIIAAPTFTSLPIRPGSRWRDMPTARAIGATIGTARIMRLTQYLLAVGADKALGQVSDGVGRGGVAGGAGGTAGAALVWAPAFWALRKTDPAIADLREMAPTPLPRLDRGCRRHPVEQAGVPARQHRSGDRRADRRRHHRRHPGGARSSRRRRALTMNPRSRSNHVARRYGRTLALDDVSFDVRRRELFALLGPNGAGKTTLLHILCTMLRPDSGSVHIEGLDVVAQPARARRDDRRGVSGAEPGRSSDGVRKSELPRPGLRRSAPGCDGSGSSEMLELVELAEWRDRLVRTLSSGMKRRVEIARALIHDSRILFLDEPTVGLDAQSRERIWQYLDRLRGERDLTVLVTTHYIEEVEGVRPGLRHRSRPDTRDRRAGRAEGRARPATAACRAARGGNGGGDHGGPIPTSTSGADDEIVLSSSGDDFAEAFLSRLRQPHPPAFGGGAEPGKRLPVADRARNPRPGGGRARAHLRVRHAGRGAHAMRRSATDLGRDRLAAAIRLQCGGLYAIWFREVKRAIRDRGQLIGGVSRPLLWVLIMGIGLNPYFRGEIYGEVRFVVPYTYLQFIFPAVIALNIHVHLGAIGGVGDLGPPVRLSARGARFAAAARDDPARQGTRRRDGRAVPRLPGAGAGAVRRSVAVAGRHRRGDCC